MLFRSQLTTTFGPLSSYAPDVKADIVVLDRFAPPTAPQRHAIWIEPPPMGSPIPVKSSAKNVALLSWRADTPLGEQLRSQGLVLEQSQVLAPAATVMVVAQSAEGPLMAARDGAYKNVVFGFHPGRGAMRNELATPILMENVLRWMSPGAFRQWEVQAGRSEEHTSELQSH